MINGKLTEMMHDWPAILREADFARLRFALDFHEPCHLTPVTTLGLRRSLRMGALRASEGVGEEVRARFRHLFDPSPGHDPVAVKKHQKPAPPFVLKPVTGEHHLDSGDRYELEVLFIGTGITLIGDFWEALKSLGKYGLTSGEGRFDVAEIMSLDLEGQPRCIWVQGSSCATPAPEIFSLDAYLQRLPILQKSVIIDVLTPARLLVKGRPLKSPGFAKLFPFMMRRVTAMLSAHCGIDVCEEPQTLMSCAEAMAEASRAWSWLDWRTIGIEDIDDKIGGFVGQLEISGRHLDKILWIVALSQLLGIGKGATYGAGHFSLRFA